MKRVGLVLALVAMVGCEKKQPENKPVAKPAEPTKAPEPGKPAPLATPAPVGLAAAAPSSDTTALWKFAPADAFGGFVVGDGSGTKALTAMNDLLKELEGKPFAKEPLAEIAKARAEAPFDFMTLEGWKKAGLDPQKGAAFFFGGPEEVSCAILPVVDRAAFRAVAKGKEEKEGDLSFDRLEKIVCAMAGERYVCANNTAELKEKMSPKAQSALAAAALAVAPSLRGDLEASVDITQAPPSAAKDLEDLGVMTSAGGSLRLAGDGFLTQIYFNGTPKAEIAQVMVNRTPSPEALAMTGGAVSVLRFAMPMAMLLKDAPPEMKVEDVDVRKDLLEQLTGEMAFVTAGKGLVGAAVLLPIEDAARVKKVVALGCKALGEQQDLPLANLKASDGTCSAVIPVPPTPVPIGIKAIPVAAAVQGKVLAVAIGDLDLAALKGSALDVASSPEAKAALAAPGYVFWSNALDFDLSQLPPEIGKELTKAPELAGISDILNYIATNLYEITGTFSVEPNRVGFMMRVTTFGSDPPEARAAYAAALDKRAKGDATAAAALAEIPTKWPQSLVARRLKNPGPVVGAPSAMVLGGMAAFFTKAGGPGSMAPEMGGPGFGPMAVPPGLNDPVPPPMPKLDLPQ